MHNPLPEGAETLLLQYVSQSVHVLGEENLPTPLPFEIKFGSLVTVMLILDASYYLQSLSFGISENAEILIYSKLRNSDEKWKPT